MCLILSFHVLLTSQIKPSPGCCENQQINLLADYKVLPPMFVGCDEISIQCVVYLCYEQPREGLKRTKYVLYAAQAG